VQAQADLAIVVEGPATFVRGEIAEFTATVTNFGPSGDPPMTILLSSNAPSGSVETTAAEGWTCNTQPSALYRAQCTRDAGPFFSPAFFMEVSTGGNRLFPPRVTVTASVVSDIDPDLSNNRSSWTARRTHP
jgi:hypothetical protein